MAAETVSHQGWGQPQAHGVSGGRLHLNHGPIDLMIKAQGTQADIKKAYAAAMTRFENLLAELVDELPGLRQPMTVERPVFRSPIAQNMAKVCWPYRHGFITPMAAVAGSVADAIKSAMLTASPGLETLYVNNGGDIAVHVREGSLLRIGLVADLARALPDGVIAIDGHSGIGGIATSGWPGRSFSLGIADAVTILSVDAATADAAATVVANAVSVESPVVKRLAASALDPDSDLGERMVTTDVGALSKQEIAAAVAAGKTVATGLIGKGQILAALIAVKGEISIKTARNLPLSLQ